MRIGPAAEALDGAGIRKNVQAELAGRGERRIAHLPDLTDRCIEAFQPFGIAPQLVGVVLGRDDEVPGRGLVTPGISRGRRGTQKCEQE